MFIPRHMLQYINKCLENFKCVLLTGARQTGKSTLLQNGGFSNYEYISMDDWTEQKMAGEDPVLFMRNHPLPFIIDEVQKTPNLLSQIKFEIDRTGENGQAILTGSQTYNLIKNTAESLAGRAITIKLLPLSMREKKNSNFNLPFIPDETYISQREKSLSDYGNIWHEIFEGGMPWLVANSKKDEKIIQDFFRAYTELYIERDVSEFINVKNKLKFKTFLSCLAARAGELFNADSIGSDVGVTSKTIGEWLGILEASGIIFILRPYSPNLSSRAIKSPKVYFADTGLLCFLAGWYSEKNAANGAMNGQIFENFAISEIIKSYYNSGENTDCLYFYRDKDKHEIDLIIEKNNILHPIEIKKSGTPTADMGKHFDILQKISGKEVSAGTVLCQCRKKTYLSNNLIALPVEYV